MMRNEAGLRHGAWDTGGAKRGDPGGTRRWGSALLLVATVIALGACGREELDTRTFELHYLPEQEAAAIIGPYVFTDRDDSPGRMSPAQGAVTVRETADNLDKIARVLERYDRPRPTVTLHFQVIEANGAAGPDPAIADVERELRRLFRFDGYELVAETQVTGIENRMIRQALGSRERTFSLEAGVIEVRPQGSPPTLTVDVTLSRGGPGGPALLETGMTIPAGHSVVVGTAQTPQFEGALILVVRAEISPPAGGAPEGAGAAGAAGAAGGPGAAAEPVEDEATAGAND